MANSSVLRGDDQETVDISDPQQVREEIERLRREKQSVNAKLRSHGGSHKKLTARRTQILQKLQELSAVEFNLIRRLRSAA